MSELCAPSYSTCTYFPFCCSTYVPTTVNMYIHMYYILNICIRIYYILTKANVRKNAGASLVTDLSKLVDGPNEGQALLGLKVIKLLEGTTRTGRTSKDRYERQCSRITCLALQLANMCIHMYSCTYSYIIG